MTFAFAVHIKGLFVAVWGTIPDEISLLDGKQTASVVPVLIRPVPSTQKDQIVPADAEEREILLVDPMLATGGSAVAAIQMLKDKGCKKIHFMCIIAAPEGVAKMQEEHPDVDMYIGALDEKLNDHGYIVPGLGDAGDRIFGTK